MFKICNIINYGVIKFRPVNFNSKGRKFQFENIEIFANVGNCILMPISDCFDCSLKRN